MNALPNRDHHAIVIWLCCCLLLVAAMVLLGGYTRLSGSGLSIVHWKIVHGIIPPLSFADWWVEFEAYQASPQYRKINIGMTMEEFKAIFWPEYFHRLLGRVVGATFFLPLVIFALRRSLPPRLYWRLLGAFLLVGAQGVMGWLMVKSGLVDNPHVSHLRLAAHLALAFAIFALILWTLLDIVVGWRLAVVSKNHQQPTTIHQQPFLTTWFLLLCLQIILGAFVAGLRGGLIFNTWPTMDGEWLPSDLLAPPLWENIVLIQFCHRTLAVFLTVSFPIWWYWQRIRVRNSRLGGVCAAVASLLALQFLLGVLTLVNAVPLHLALSHQMTALALFGAAVVLLYGVMNDRLRKSV